MTSGFVTQIQKFALEDGPGIRTTVFLKGCPLACAWCHNPENINRHPQVVVLETRCVRCGQCCRVCPQPGDPPTYPGSAADTPISLRVPADCLRCGACIEACPTGARVMLGQEQSVAEVLAQVLADRPFYEESGGGLTVSGGEPLLQFAFLRALLLASRAEGLHTAVDTCGFAPKDHLLALLPLVDLFLYDLKVLNDDRHRELTGVSNRVILENLRGLAAHRATLWLRIPIVPGINNAPAELEALARFASNLGCVRQVNLLPYHQTGIAKFRRLHQPYRLESVMPPSPETMTLALQAFLAFGLPTKIGG